MRATRPIFRIFFCGYISQFLFILPTHDLQMVFLGSIHLLTVFSLWSCCVCIVCTCGLAVVVIMIMVISVRIVSKALFHPSVRIVFIHQKSFKQHRTLFRATLFKKSALEHNMLLLTESAVHTRKYLL